MNVPLSDLGSFEPVLRELRADRDVGSLGVLAILAGRSASMSSADLLEELEANGIRVKYLGTPFIASLAGRGLVSTVVLDSDGRVAPTAEFLAQGADVRSAIATYCSEAARQLTVVDTLDFQDDCRFCQARDTWTVAEYGSVWLSQDGHPVSEGHHLVIPKRHAADLFAMTREERADADAMIQAIRAKLVEDDPTIAGFNVGMNCGKEAGQSIYHAHWHVIPRRAGDSKAKKGGVRGVIPEKMEY